MRTWTPDLNLVDAPLPTIIGSVSICGHGSAMRLHLIFSFAVQSLYRVATYRPPLSLAGLCSYILRYPPYVSCYIATTLAIAPGLTFTSFSGTGTH